MLSYKIRYTHTDKRSLGLQLLRLLHAMGEGIESQDSTVATRKLEHDRPPAPNQRKKDDQHKSSYIHVPTVWSLL